MKNYLISPLFIAISTLVIVGCTDNTTLLKSNLESVNSFRDFSDSTLGLNISFERMIYDSFIVHVKHSQLPIIFFAKKATCSTIDTSIILFYFAIEGDLVKGELLEARNHKFKFSNFEFSKDYTDRFNFCMFCNNLKFRVKNTSKEAFDYSLLTRDENGVERFSVRKDTGGIEINQFKEHCNQYWIEENANFIDQLIGLAKGTSATYDF